MDEVLSRHNTDNPDEDYYFCPKCQRVWHIYGRVEEKLFYPSIPSYGKERKKCPIQDCKTIGQDTLREEFTFRELLREGYNLRKNNKEYKNEFTVKEISYKLDIHTTTVQLWFKKGLKRYKKNGKNYVKKKDLKNFIKDKKYSLD